MDLKSFRLPYFRILHNDKIVCHFEIQSIQSPDRYLLTIKSIIGHATIVNQAINNTIILTNH